MNQTYICPQHHRWQAGDQPGDSSPDHCPVCGAPPAYVAPADGPSLGRAEGQSLASPEAASQDITPTILASSGAAREKKDSQDRTLAPELPTGALAVGRTITGYEILGELGRGGMGVVYKAKQLRLNRLVALKMILAGSHASPEQLARFRAEAEALAPLQHTNIVQVYDVGELEGHPYFSLEYVEGGSLAQVIGGTPQPARSAAQLVETLARAMHFAHLRGIIHRDLKPANILLQKDKEPRRPGDKETEQSPVSGSPWLVASLSSAVPKITDFGLAKNLESDAGHTRTGAILGTPSYISPEQALGRKEIGPPTDIYSLGAILYELLTGRPPFRGESSMDTMLQVTTEEPVPPRRLQPKAPADLETICLKCLEKQPHKRYASAEALADDLKRFLAGEPIKARPVGVVERTIKWAKRRPALASAVLVGLLAVLGMLGGSLYYNAELSGLNKRIQGRNQELAVQKDRAEQEWQRAEDESHRARAAQKVAEEQQRLAEERLEDSLRSNYAFQLIQVAGLAQRDPLLGLQLLTDEQRCPARLRDFTWQYLHRLCQREKATLPVVNLAVTCLALSADGKLLATAGGDEDVTLWDLDRKAVARTLKTNHAGPIVALAFAPDAPVLATGGFDKTVKLYNAVTSGELASFAGHTEGVRAVAFSPDGKVLASGSHDRSILVWDLAGQRARATLSGHKGSVSALAFSADGQMLASAGGDDRSVRLWDVAGARELAALTGHRGDVLAVAFAPGQRTLASAGADRTIRLWDVADKKLLDTLQGHLEAVQALAFTPDGKTLASGSHDGTIKLWNPAAGEARTTLRGHSQAVQALALGRDGQMLVSASADKTLKLWDINVAPEARTFRVDLYPDPPRPPVLAWSRDGRVLATVNHVDRALRLWDLPAEQERVLLTGFSARLEHLALAPDGKTLAAVTDEPSLRLYDLAKGKLRVSLPGPKTPTRGLLYSPNSKLLAWAGDEPVVHLWDANGTMLPPLPAGPVRCLAFSPDGKALAIGDDRSIKIWDLAPRKLRADLGNAGGPARQLAFAPDGKTLAAVTGTVGTLALWHLDPQPQRVAVKGTPAAVRCLAFSPDGKVLATGHADWSVVLWDALMGQERATLTGHTQPVHALTFADEGRVLFSLTEDGTVRRWQGGALPGGR